MKKARAAPLVLTARVGGSAPDPIAMAATLTPALPMSDTRAPDAPPPPDPAPKRKRKRRHVRSGLPLMLGLVVAALFLAVSAFVLSGRPLRLPVVLVAETESRVNQALSGGAVVPGASVTLGSLMIVVDRDWVPRLHIEDLRLIDPSGHSIAQLPEVQVAVDGGELMHGRIRPSGLRIIGAQTTLRRLADGRFDLVIGSGPPPGNLVEVLDRVEAAFDLPLLSSLHRIEAEALTLTLDDLRARRVWQIGDGRITLDNRPDELALELGFGLVGGGEAPARATLTIISSKGSAEARVSANVDQVAAADIAAQSPALAWLGVLDAPISGRLSAASDSSGGIGVLDGGLEIGAGALRPAPQTRPISFDRAGLSFHLDTAAEKIVFTDLSVESASLRLAASGHTYVPGLASGLPSAFVSQVAIDDLQVDPEGLFEEPMHFSEGAVDMRLTLDPFRVEIGQVALQQEGRHLLARGSVGADSRGWSVAVDLSLDEIRHDRLFALWPLGLVPATRAWLIRNVQQGALFDVQAGVRLRPGEEPRLSLSYEFAKADVRFLRTLPPIRDGYGYAVIEGRTYTQVLDRGSVTPPLGGRIDVTGSLFRVEDITRKPAFADITLRTDSTVTAALSLLDEPPFGFLKKAGRPVQVADGRAITETHLRMPLKPRITIREVAYSVTGTLHDVTSDILAPGRLLKATELGLTADATGMTISGPGTLGAVAFDATWSQPFGPDAKPESRIEGRVTLSPDFLSEFGIGLPEGSVRGEGAGQMTLVLPRGGGGTFALTSDLVGLDLRLGAVGWSKPAGQTGTLDVSGRFGAPAVVDRLVFDAPGLSAEGSITLRPGGGLDLARFPRVVLGRWLEGSVDLKGRGPGKSVAIAVTGGRLDLRRIPETRSDSSGRGAPPLEVTLDRLSVSDGIALTGFRGSFSQTGGFNGDFTASINGAAPVTGTVAPTRSGTAVRLKSGDAGAVLKAAGIFERARGGTLDLTLTPRVGRGDYDGQVRVKNIRVRNAPALAELLGAISVVGLLEQLNNSGIVFTDADAEFRLTPDAIELTRSAAVGASLGVSMAGLYDIGTKGLKMQGVISPVYLLNGIGSIFGQKGEGLFGFNYALTGTSEDPRVSVNPLSILTPGMFREIFRSPPPKIIRQ